MKNFYRILSAIILLTVISGCQTSSGSYAWPSGSWVHSTPSQQGLDASTIGKGFDFIEQKQLNLHSLVVARNGKLATTAYFHPYESRTPVRIQSITKSVVSLLVGIAIDQGKIKSINQPVMDFFPGRLIPNLDANKKAITIKHLLTMTSGLDCDDGKGSANAMIASNGWVDTILSMPMADAPGTTFRYCSGNSHLLGVILEKAVGKNIREFANEVLFEPIGISPVPGSRWVSDPQGYPDGSSGLYLTPEDVARLGWLYITGGKWEEKQIVKKQWIDNSLKAYVAKGDGSSYGYLWTVYPEQDHAAALGMGGQQIHLYPKQNLVVVITAGLPIAVQSPDIEQLLKENILGAISSSGVADGTQKDEELQAKINQVKTPRQPVSALPAIAADITGKTITLAENPQGYQKLTVRFTPGSSDSELIINDLPPFRIGMDHLYRANGNPGGSQIFVRGSWLDEKTFILEQTTLGELADIRSGITFDGSQVKITVSDAIFGGQMFDISGTLSQ